NDRAEYVDVVTTKRAQTRDELLAGEIESLVDGREPVGGDGLDAHERSADVRPAHGVEKCRIFGRLHRDLRVEHEIIRQLGKARHQRESLRAQCLELTEPRTICTSLRLRQVAECHGVEVVVGERNETKSETPQLDDLADHAIDSTGAGLLAVGSPDRTERTVLRAAA